MSSYKVAVVGLLSIALLTLAIVVHFAIAGKGAHLANADCGSCHLAGKDVNAMQASRLVATQEQLCIKCHKRAIEVSHPTGFAPSRALPADFPLDWKGDLTCSTCHLIHGADTGMLRGKKRGKDFCLSCHEPSFFSRMKDSGTSLVISGHLFTGGSRGTADIDPHSLHCLGCHTAGSYAGGGSVSVGSKGILRHSSGSAPHPIGRSYRDAARSGDFHPEQQLAQKNIMLSDGRVSCVSCHEAYKKEHGKLVVTLHRSALCLSCHAK